MKDNVFKFVYMPRIGIVEEGKTMDETMKNINRAEAILEIRDKREKRKLERRFPGCEITKFGSSWYITPINKCGLDMTSYKGQ